MSPHPLTLPNLEQQLGYLAKSKYFIKTDVMSGFDFLRTDESAWDIFVISTPLGAFCCLGSPQGWCNTPALYQNRIVNQILRPLGIFAMLNNGVVQWIDDSLIHSSTIEGLLETFEKFVEQVEKMGVRLSLDKCTLFATVIEYCGRVVQDGKWNFSEEMYDKILKVGRPSNELEMAKICWVLAWLSPALPNAAAMREQLTRGLDLTGKASVI